MAKRSRRKKEHHPQQTVTLRNLPEMAEVRRLKKKHKTPIAVVLGLALQNGLPIADRKLTELRAPVQPVSNVAGMTAAGITNP